MLELRLKRQKQLGKTKYSAQFTVNKKLSYTELDRRRSAALSMG